MATLESNGDLKIFLFCLCSGGQNAPNPGGVHGHGFFEKGVFSQTHGFLEVRRSEGTRGAEDDDIRERDGLFVGFKADEPLRLRNVRAIPMLRLKRLQAAREFVRKKISDCDQSEIWVCEKSLIGGSRAASAAAYQSQFEGLIGCDSPQDGWERSTARNGQSGPGLPQEGAAI